ncbi:MAG: CRISPR-associated ring nuclease Csm6 [Verrucomicrobia bacterium]|nr:CRISPR-associated ring nuclease Csm6 [Verrucomicrobiota bacterium]
MSEDIASPSPPLTAQPETVLLAVTGMSPAVLTETVWALAHEPEPVIPSRVIVLTTASGRDALVARLFAPHPAFAGRSPWDTLREALAGEGHDLRGRLRFGTTPDDIRVITAVDPATGRSRELDDLRSPADNEAAANFLLEQVRTVVENPDTGLVASLAGGRKTMGALLYACLTLVGRETDRLTHVLVNEPFETSRDFFFPGQPGDPSGNRTVRPRTPRRARVPAPPPIRPMPAWSWPMCPLFRCGTCSSANWAARRGRLPTWWRAAGNRCAGPRANKSASPWSRAAARSRSTAPVSAWPRWSSF